MAFFTIGRLPTIELAREFMEAYRSNPDFVAPGTVVAVGLLALSGLVLAFGALPVFLLRWRRLRAACPQTLVGMLLALALVLLAAVCGQSIDSLARLPVAIASGWPCASMRMLPETQVASEFVESFSASWLVVLST